jgi:hypothetical protein
MLYSSIAGTGKIRGSSSSVTFGDRSAEADASVRSRARSRHSSTAGNFRESARSTAIWQRLRTRGYPLQAQSRDRPPPSQSLQGRRLAYGGVFFSCIDLMAAF